MFYFLGSCGSTHLIEFAEQIHKKAGRVRAARPRSRARIAPAFLYKGRKNVSEGRGFSSGFDRKRGFNRVSVRSEQTQ